MKTLIKNNGIIKIASAVLLTILFGFSIQAQAATKVAAFDHTQTGYILKDVHLTLRCEQCHVDGIFKNTPTTCAGCHAVGTRVSATPQPLNHVQTIQSCDTCHFSAASFQAKSFNHMTVTGNCMSCHGGQSLGVLAMPSTHIPLSAYPISPDCVSCHTNTTTFQSYASANVHLNITGGCSQCHGGPPGADAGPGAIGTYPGVASYNQATHLPISAATTGVSCYLCHTQSNTSNYTNFLGAIYTHSSLDSNKCGSCHEGQYAGVVAYVSGVHIPLPAGSNCAPCHFDPSFSPLTKPSFLGAAYHTSSNGGSVSAITSSSLTCKSCHSGSYASQNAQPVGSTHIPTNTADCSGCHTDSSGSPINNTSSYTTFSNAKFHLSTAFTSNPTAVACSTCHNGRYTSAPESAQSQTTGSYTTHIPVNGVDCIQCHTAANTGVYTSFLGAIFHQSPIGTSVSVINANGLQCVTCHGGGYAAQGAWPVSYPTGNHIPFTGDCSVCHTDSTGSPLNNTSSYTVFQNAKFHQSSAGTSPAGLCSTCHISTYVSEGAYTTSSVISNHVAVKAGVDCVACHTIASTGSPSFTTFLNATYAHSGTYGVNSFPQSSGQSPTCFSCHDGIIATGKNAGHISYGATDPQTGKTWDCNSSSCHTPSTDGCSSTGNCLNFSGVKYDHSGTYTTSISGNTVFPQSSTVTPTPSCVSCHNGSSTATGAQGISSFPSHVPTSSDCYTCHTAASSDTGCGVTGSTCATFLNAKFNHNTVASLTGQCGTCHESQYANVVSLASVTHIPQSNSLACDACHTNAITGITATFTSTQTQTFANVKYHDYTGAAPTTCSGCHNGAFTPGPSAYGTNAANTVTAVGAMATNSVANYTHIATTGLECNSCHVSTTSYTSTTGFGTVTPPTYASSYALTFHSTTNTPNGGCGTCHLGQYPTVVSLNSATHIPQTYGNACNTCHTYAAPQTFGNVLFHSIANVGNPAPAACSTCHSGAYTPAVSATGAQGTNTATLAVAGAYSTSSVITNHAPLKAGQECGDSLCHTITNTNTYTTFTGASPNHTSYYASWISTATFPTAPISSPLPTCTSCHSSGGSGKSWSGVTGHPTPTAAQDCISSGCHTSGVVVGCPATCTDFGRPAVIHTTAFVNGKACAASGCHDGVSGPLGADPTIHIPTTGTTGCGQCHPVDDAAGSIDFSTNAKITNTAANGGTVSVYTMNHTGTGVGTACATVCHVGTKFSSQGKFGPQATTAVAHIPTDIYNTLGCVGCHATFTPNTNFAITAGATQWAMATTAMGVTQHNSDPGGGATNLLCQTCHGTSVAYLEANAKLSSKHNNGKNCAASSCHKPGSGGRGTAYVGW